MRKKVVLLSMGTRPEIIKMAPVYHALKASSVQPRVLHTGQHDDLAWPLYSFFQMEPAYCLDLERERNTLSHLSARLLERLDELLDVVDVEAMLVHGDTTSALMAALAAFYHKIPIGHVEAGLRSYDGYNPFPEEKNRVLIGQLARWHFAPTQQSVRHLATEGIAPRKIHCVGNTVVDATRWGMAQVLPYFSQIAVEEAWQVQHLTQRAEGKRLMLVTAHRRENWGRPITEVARTVRRLVETHDDLHVVWPVHPNPIVRDAVEEAMDGLAPDVENRLMLTGPVNYPQMLWLMQHAWLVLTDSGGLQEEAAAMNVPVLVLRENTERPELIESGGGVLVGTAMREIWAWVNRLRTDQAHYDTMAHIDNPFGDGRAAEYIARILQHELLATQTDRLVHAA